MSLGRVAGFPSQPPSLDLAVEDGEQLVEGLRHPPQVTSMASVVGVRVMAEVIIGQLLQPCQLGVDLPGARGVR